MKKTRALALFFVSLALCGFDDCERDGTKMLIGSGFTMVSPPSNLYAPGAIVMQKIDEAGAARLRLICGPRANLGPYFNPRVSDTLSSIYKMSKTQRVSLEADAVEKFRARTKVEEVQSVMVSFTNARVLEIDEAEVFENIDERTLACRAAIEARREAGYHPTFVTSAYAADVEYIVNFKRDAELTKSVKEKRMAQIAANLGGGHTSITEHSLKAVNLILAVRADEFLMRIQPNGELEATLVKPNTGLPGSYAEIEPGSDAPVVPPAGGWASPVRESGR